MTVPRSTPAPVLTEKQFMAQVIDLARTFGWAVYHPYLSVRSAPGWPDLALVRPPRLVLAELKTDKGRLTGHQHVWLDLLRRCAGVEVFVWRPAEWDGIVRELCPGL